MGRVLPTPGGIPLKDEAAVLRTVCAVFLGGLLWFQFRQCQNSQRSTQGKQILPGVGVTLAFRGGPVGFLGLRAHSHEITTSC